MIITKEEREVTFCLASYIWQKKILIYIHSGGFRIKKKVCDPQEIHTHLLPKSMLLDFRVLTKSNWLASPNCLVRFSDMLCRPNPSLWKARDGSTSGLKVLEETENNRLSWKKTYTCVFKDSKKFCISKFFCIFYFKIFLFFFGGFFCIFCFVCVYRHIRYIGTGYT